MATFAIHGSMVTMFRGPRWKIAVYGRDHGVPHFHIEGPDFRCSVAIAPFDVIVGTVSAAVLKDALEWARPNQALHMQTWQELDGRTPPQNRKRVGEGKGVYVSVKLG